MQFNVSHAMNRNRLPRRSSTQAVSARKRVIRCASGKCWLVGSGPGDVDHLTMRAVRLLKEADVVLYDDLASKEALELCRTDAEKIYVGKRGGQTSIKQQSIDQLLAKVVVRLKGGCPSVLSRVHSEVAALQQAGIQYELVPGISSALAAPVLAGFPLTHPELGKSFAVVSGHDAEGTDWGAFTRIDTLVLLMSGRSLPYISTELQAQGWPASTPVAVIKAAGTAEQRTWKAELSSVVEVTSGSILSPCVIVVGQVAAL